MVERKTKTQGGGYKPLKGIEPLQGILKRWALGEHLLWNEELRGELKNILANFHPSLGCEISGDYDVQKRMFIPGAKLILNAGGSTSVFVIAHVLAAQLSLEPGWLMTAQLGATCGKGMGRIDYDGEEMEAVDIFCWLEMVLPTQSTEGIWPVTVDVLCRLNS
jgi:hypothetical protein